MINIPANIRRLVATIFAISFISFSLYMPQVKADDTEVFLSSGSTANVLFVFDLSGSMDSSTSEACPVIGTGGTDGSSGSNGLSGPSGGNGNGNNGNGKGNGGFKGGGLGTCNNTKRRYQAMMDSLITVLGNLKDRPNLRVGLSLFGMTRSTTNASGIRWPIRDITEDANLTDSDIPTGTYQTHGVILQHLANMSDANGMLWTGGADVAGQGTSIVAALYEAALYFKGGNVSSGFGGFAPPSWDVTNSRYPYNPDTWVFDWDCWCWIFTAGDGGTSYSAHKSTYTPVTAWNSSTNTFDPAATYISPIVNSCDKNYIVLLSDGAPNGNAAVSSIETLIGKTCSGSGGEQCGREIVEYLANTNLKSGQGITPSNVITHTIGFNVGGSAQTFMEDLASNGGGAYHPADDTASLEKSLTTILDVIDSENETFTGLSSSVNAGQLSSDSRVFMSIFKPSDNRSWIGNTKGYFIDPNNGFVDVNGAVATVTNPTSGDYGKFKASAQSFWTTSADGGNVDLGGLAGKLQTGNRNIYTTAPGGSTLVDIAHSSITYDQFNLADTSQRTTLLNWLDDEAPMGDPLHAASVMVPYSSGKDILFTMTNQGVLHIFDVTNPTSYGDTTGGTELSAFIPQSLLPNLEQHRLNINSSDHLYGLDGSITYLKNNGKTYLYFGMRRGGNQYFALDVTNPSAPKFLWQIDGGTGSFSTLGQTWSRPVVTTIHWAGASDRKVLIFGGGYNPAQDGYTTRTQDTIGNAIYIVDALTGAKLWSVGSDNSHSSVISQMVYSIPADLTVIDADNDKHSDRIYFGDMGGQLWRIDLKSSGSSTSLSTYRLADFAFGSESNAANLRRFYTPPSVALINDAGNFHYAVAIGSGFRAHPKSSDVNDRFYMLKDTILDSDGTGTSNWSMLTESSLYNVTNNVIGEGNAASKTAALASLSSKKGWYLELGSTGEKSLSPSLIFNNQLAFTTYTPPGSGLVCGVAAGSGSLYLISLTDATPVQDLVPSIIAPGTDALTAQDRKLSTPGVGIPGAPLPYFPPGKGEVNIYVGTENIANMDNPMARINWKVIE
ncbi:MAG: pilus assembly protein [Gammaproteobacteria bacterium]